jgi:hypothetical protein
MLKKALLLNSDWSPLKFINEKDAIYLLYLNKAEMVSLKPGHVSKWPIGHKLVTGGEFPAGATLRLFDYVNKRFRNPRFRRSVVFARDSWRCQYCGMRVSNSTATIDHVIPVSRGGKTSWDNCVTACSACNKKKKDHTLEETQMNLRSRPKPPDQIHFWNVSKADEWHKDWEMFLSTKVVE